MRAANLQLVLVVASIAPGVGALVLINYLARYRGRPGVNWFIATLTAVGLFCTSYGVGLAVFDPTSRVALETVMFVSGTFLGPLFLGFGLCYTGRTDAVRTLPFGFVLAVPVLTVFAGVTNPVFGLLWTDFYLDPVFGAATVSYAVQPWGAFAFLFALLTSGLGALLVLETILSYGPLYRREATAVVLSTVPPTLGFSLLFVQLGPVPQLNFVPILFIPHLLLDAYAFVGTHMFETNPTTQRAAERSALDDLNDPLLVVDTEHRLVRLNERAKQLLGVDSRTTLPVPLVELTGTTLDRMRTEGELSLAGPRGGEFAVSYTPLTDPRDDDVGGMVVLYDITDERRRKQQLTVLNRVLRHNLRNEMGVIRGYAQLIDTKSTDPQLSAHAETVVDSSQRLLSIGEKARDFDRVQSHRARISDVDVAELLEETCRDLRTRYPDAVVGVDAATSQTRLRTDSELLSLTVSNLVENAVAHADTADSPVTVGLRSRSRDEVGERSETTDETVIEVRDRNRRVPVDEIASLREGDESALQHGSGIGLWIVQWCVTALNGRIEFDYDEGNVVTVTLPTGDEPDTQRRRDPIPNQ